MRPSCGWTPAIRQATSGRPPSTWSRCSNGTALASSRSNPNPNRVNVVARLKGNGAKRPLLLMAHTDVVTVDPRKWTFPPFSATRDGGYVYGRGAIDDKDNVVAALMTMLMLKRLNVPLDRDVIFLAEAGDEGTTRVGIQ
ncbi:MAG: M20/M25/M40 family metallo-hydrolase [Luteitalea sp.]|nr:M20/M25/M40 family metallo-hydrolase [Luteitalea sp.]